MSGKKRADGKEVWPCTVLEDLLSIVGRQAQMSAKVIGKNEFNPCLSFFVHYKLSTQTGAIASAERKPGGGVKTENPDEV